PDRADHLRAGSEESDRAGQPGRPADLAGRPLDSTVPVGRQCRRTGRSRQFRSCGSGVPRLHENWLPEVIPGSGRSEHPLAYPLTVTFGALAVITAWAPFADVDQLSALAAVGVGIVGYSGVRVARALGWLGSGVGADESLAVKRVRQQHRLVSRSWL